MQKQISKYCSESGIVLVATMYLLVALLALLGAFFIISNYETGSFRGTRKATQGFYTAEAGLNLRAEEIRQIFVGYNRPSGTAPTSSSPCSGSNQGSGDYICKNYALNNRTSKTYVVEAAGNPIITTIPPGELYQGLNAQEYRYTVKSTAYDLENKPEAILELRFKSRLVPLFQFVAFYDKDLEILPGPSMNLSGPVHTNGDLYLQSDNVLSIAGQVSTAGFLFRGRKNDATCTSNSTQIKDPGAYRQLIPSCPARTQVLTNNVTNWNGMIQIGVSRLTLPPVGAIDNTPGQIYWDHADLRLMLHLNAANNLDTTNAATGVEVRNQNNSVNTTATTQLNSSVTCPGPTISGTNWNIANRVVGSSGFANGFYNNREGKTIKMLEVDMRGLLDCLKRTNWFGSGKTLDDSSDGGLVIYLGVDGPNAGAASSGYGVRLRDAATLQSTIAGAPSVRGLTVVTNQAAFTWGNYNNVNWIPAAIMSDTFNPLSNNWKDAVSSTTFSPICPNGAACSTNSGTGNAAVATNNRVATNTTVYAAVMSGTDTTGNVEGTGGQGGAYNGGLENYPRFHEYWTGLTFTYLGSFVSLNQPRKSNGTWVYGAARYTAPTRLWDYDTRFNNAANLPPLTPRFVYLRQELFVRDFEQ